MAYNASQFEKEMLAFWDKEKIFERSVNERPKNNPYVFYDGPPFATGLPHYGHIVASVMKDAVPRYVTMQGKRVERVWGWDCHGLPIENIVEKELGTKSKQDIEALGVAKFNELCRSKVLSYVADWQKTIHRLGRWVDMDHAYRTMDKEYMESVWWVFKQLWDKQLVYQGYRPMHICPRCETTLSQQEVSEGYKDIKDLSVTAKFRLKNAKETLRLDGDVYMLAWTTTPWTLPGNVLLAVAEKVQYGVVVCDGVSYIVALNLVEKHFDGKAYEVVQQISGAELVGVEYEPLFSYFADSTNSFRVVTADFVTTEDGTGIVHLAPAFGTDDYEVFKKENVPFIQHVGMDGRFIEAVTDFAGMHVKPVEDHMATDVEIVKWLAHNGKLFSKQKYEHSYPHCWRCDTPLINYATSSWFVNVTAVKEQALKQAEKINWSPDHIKEGRFGKWLEGARDWSISRQRFWASVIPVWKSEDGDMICVGSIAELEVLSGETVTDLHKHVVDLITFEKDGKMYTRVPDVLDTWFDSGSMPYAQLHYPFEQTETFEAGFPAEFIAEGQDQTRAWFYYLHILATALTNGPAFKHVIVNGIVLAEDGKKMSKKLKNYPDPMEVLERYGADALRYYLLSSPVVNAENVNFAEIGVREVFNKVINSVANVLSFYDMYAPAQGVSYSLPKQPSMLDQWLLSRLQELITIVTTHMNAYQLADASRPIMDFVADLSQWYVRRSRDRFKSEQTVDSVAATETLGYVLLELSKVMAPFMPFISERIYQELKKRSTDALQTSVHLEEWPRGVAAHEQKTVLEHMAQSRLVVEYVLSLRKEAGIKVRQPLGGVEVVGLSLSQDYLAIIQDEVNVKDVRCVDTLSASFMSKTDNGMSVALDTTVNEELLQEGVLRELVRAVNMLRKDAGLTIHDNARIMYTTADELIVTVITKYEADLLESTASVSIEQGEASQEQRIHDALVYLNVEKV